jgi:hypothetical protein
MDQANRCSRRSIHRTCSKVLLCLICFSTLLGAKVLDRIAIIVNRQVITEAQLEEEIRVTAFLNREPVTEDRSTKKRVSDRLIQQLLVRHEMELSQYPFPTEDQTKALFEETEQQFGGAQPFLQNLDKYQLTPAILREHLGFQLMMLKFIDFRFRPDVDISESDIRRSYAEQLETWKRSHTTAPPDFEQSRASIEKTLSDQRVDYALSSWLEEARREATIVFLDKELN